MSHQINMYVYVCVYVCIETYCFVCIKNNKDMQAYVNFSWNRNSSDFQKVRVLGNDTVKREKQLLIMNGSSTFNVAFLQFLYFTCP